MRKPVLEILEVRRLLSASFAAHVNFQTAGPSVASGYSADSGAPYAAQANGLTYGWIGTGARVIDRNMPAVDPRYDTFAVMNARGRGSDWQIAVPNGTYQVSIAAGDARALGAEQILVNSAIVVNGKATRAHRTVPGSQTIVVTNGLLKVASPHGAKIDCIDITQTGTGTGTGTGAGSGFKWDHIVVVVEENEPNGAILGPGAADDPYIQSLAAQGTIFSNSKAVTHPSQPNYLALFSGSTQGVTNDNLTGPLFGENLARQLDSAGLTFAGYSEDLPSTGSTVETSGAYARKHNPWSDFTNVPLSENMPFANFPTDFTRLPNVAFVVPNLNDDMHDGPISQGDQWLRDNIDAYAQWAKANNSLLIVTWDENDGSSSSNKIPTFAVGARVAAGQTSTQPITHYDVFRTIEDVFNLTPINNAKNANDLTLG